MIITFEANGSLASGISGNGSKQLTFKMTSQNKRCFLIVPNVCRNDDFKLSSVNLKKPTSSMQSSKMIEKKIYIKLNVD